MTKLQLRLSITNKPTIGIINDFTEPIFIKYISSYCLICWTSVFTRNEEKLKKFREDAKAMQRQKDYEKYMNGGKLGQAEKLI